MNNVHMRYKVYSLRLIYKLLQNIISINDCYKCCIKLKLCGIIVVIFNQGIVEKQLFITDERVTLNKYI